MEPNKKEAPGGKILLRNLGITVALVIVFVLLCKLIIWVGALFM